MRRAAAVRSPSGCAGSSSPPASAFARPAVSPGSVRIASTPSVAKALEQGPDLYAYAHLLATTAGPISNLHFKVQVMLHK